MPELSVVFDKQSYSPELRSALKRLHLAGSVKVNISGTDSEIDAGVPFPIAILQPNESTGRARRTREFGAIAVLKLVNSLITNPSTF